MASMATPERRRKAYQCLRCLHKMDRTYIGARYRVTNHFLKQHLNLDEVPFYCKLCLFRCFKREDLVQHRTSFTRHHMMLKEKGVEDDDNMMVENPRPYHVTDRDVAALSQDESLAHWTRDTKKARDPLAKAIGMNFPEGLQSASPASSGVATPMTALAAPQSSVEVPHGQAFLQLQQLIASAFQPVLGNLLSANQPAAAVNVAGTATPNAEDTEIKRYPDNVDPLRIEEAALLEVTTSRARQPSSTPKRKASEDDAEDIMADILPSKSPKLDFDDRSGSQSPPSVSSSASDSSSDGESEALNELKAEVAQNSRLMKKQGANLAKLTELVVGLAQTINANVTKKCDAGTQTARQRSPARRSPVQHRHRSDERRARPSSSSASRNKSSHQPSSYRR